MKDKKTLSRKRIFKSRQTQHDVEVNFVVTKTATVMTEVEKKDTETYVAHNKENKAEISIATKMFYVVTENRRDVRPTKTNIL